jgi:hypothetical protein
MAAMVPIAAPGILESLPPRPPTPPREAHNESTAQSTRTLRVLSSRSSTLHTPPSIYSSDPANAADSTAGSRGTGKRVGFSEQAQYQDPPIYPEGEIRKHRPTPASLPRNTLTPKSILKPTSFVPTVFDPATFNSSGTGNSPAEWLNMLDSLRLQLAGSDRDSKVDAYMMLARALKESDSLPERVALRERINDFLHCIQRDIVQRTSEGALDSSLVNHALGLLITFLGLPAISRMVSEDSSSCSSIVDHCIRSFEDPTIPKDVIRHLMQVMAQQNFSSRVLTSERVARLVSALHKIEEHIKGKSIIMSRVYIYRKLVMQVKQQMISHSDWLLDLFTDMLSTVKEIRNAAISLGLEAAFNVNHDRALSRRVMEIFNLVWEEQDQKYIQYYLEKLRSMVADRQQSASVPRIWSVIMLLLRCPFDKWEYFPDWLKIIQSSFNSGDTQTKIEANHAWGCLASVVFMDERLFSDPKKRMAILKRPLGDQLTRKTRQIKELREAVLGGICNLFYYAFRPNVNLVLLDSYWDHGVVPLMKELMERKSDDAMDYCAYATRILAGLFDCVRSRLWQDSRVMSKSPADPSELPAIEPKWIRRNAGRVFAIVEPILVKNFLDIGDDKSETFKMWQSLVSSVASAASKEIKVSTDTAAFVAQSFNVVRKIWRQGLPSTGNGLGSTAFLEATQAYLKVMTSALGQLPFTEKMLSTDDKRNFVPVSTPSHRSNKSHGLPKAPIYHLFLVLSTLPTGIPDDDVFALFFGSVFAPFLQAKSIKAQVDLAQDLLSSIPMDAICPYGPWQFCADRLVPWLGSRQGTPRPPTNSGGDILGPEYRDVMKLLERGLRSTPNLPRALWKSLFQALFNCVKHESGDAGVAIAVIEPLALTGSEMLGSTAFPSHTISNVELASDLLSVAVQPNNRQAVDAALRRIWGTSKATLRSSSFDTFDSLYKLTNATLDNAYSDSGFKNLEGLASLIQTLSGFLDRCNGDLVLKTATQLQAGIAPWILDARRVLANNQRDILFPSVSRLSKTPNRLTDLNLTEHRLHFFATLSSGFCQLSNPLRPI